MKLVSLNIECNKHYERFLPFLKKENPDVICLQEVLEEDFEFIKKELGCQGIFKPFEYVVSPHPNYVNLLGKKFGNAIFSKNIIDSGYFFYWGLEENCRVSYEEYRQRREDLRSYVLMWVDIQDESGKTYRYVTTHFPVTKEGESTPHQLEILEPFFRKLDEFGEFVLCGDFNAPRGKETFTRLSKKYTDNIPDTYVTSIDQHLHRMKNIQFMVDGLFTTPKYIASDVSLIDGVSDHMAIVATINRT